MQQYLTKTIADPNGVFRLRNPGKPFLSHIKFETKRPLSEATTDDFTLTYDGEKTQALLSDVLGGDYKDCVRDQQLQISKPPQKEAHNALKSVSFPTWGVEVPQFGVVSCMEVGELFQVIKFQRDIFSICLHGCEERGKVASQLAHLNNIGMIKNIHYHQQTHGKPSSIFISLCRAVTKCILELLNELGNMEKNSTVIPKSVGQPPLRCSTLSTTSSTAPSEAQAPQHGIVYLATPLDSRESGFLINLLGSSIHIAASQELASQNSGLLFLEPFGPAMYVHSNRKLRSLSFSGCRVQLRLLGRYRTESELISLLHKDHINEPRKPAIAAVGKLATND